MRFYLIMCVFLLMSMIFGSEDTEKLSKATIKFALDILKANGNPDENMFFSPASISICVGLVYAGAKDQTKDEIASALYQNMNEQEVYDQMKQLSVVLYNKSKDYDLNIANRAYIDKTFNILAKYSNTLKNYFKSEIITEDFSQTYENARQIINTWVEQTTNTKIKDLLSQSSLDAFVRFILINAIYFKGDWAVKFKQGNTAKENFYSSSYPNLQVDMMQQENQKFFYNKNEDAQVLGLPYVNEQLVFYIILPNERNSLQALESTLRTENNFVSLLKNSVKIKLNEVQVPKFKLELSLDLKSTLQKLNVSTMFNEHADFSGINGKKDFFVSKALHKAYIEVNEEGSEAVAATAIVHHGMSVSISDDQISFIADHPFLFSIVDRRTWIPLFLGRFIG